MNEEYVLPAGFPQPTVYARLMDSAIKDPLKGWERDVSLKVAQVLDTFENAGLEHLKKAYAAGVADGYRQALIELEQSSGC